jgi:carboxymethylenebutenolidase
MGQWVELKASDGFTLQAYRAEASGTRRGALVVVQEVFGVNSHIRSVCDGYAKDGYLAIAPALFDRAQRGVELGYTDADIARGRDLKGKVTIDQALLDVTSARDAVAGAGKVGIVGYCWGGFVTWMAAARVPGFACAIPYYGGGMLENMNEQPKCPVLAHFGRTDQHIPVEGVQKLAAAHPEAKVHVYDAGHGFNCDQRGSYEAASAKLARERSLEFLARYVG